MHHVQNCIIDPPFAPFGWPYPSVTPCGPYTLPYNPCPDFEMERLRALERQALREQEKDRLRQRLRRLGISESEIQGLSPCISSTRGRIKSASKLDDVLKQIR